MTTANLQESDDAAVAQRLLELVRGLVLELQPRRHDLRVGLDSSLDRELGFDSLSRVELLQRIERDLNVHLPEDLFSEAETLRDLLHATLAARRAPTSPTDAAAPRLASLALGAAEAVPADVDTLGDVVRWHAGAAPQRPHARVYEAGARAPLTITYQDLLTGAQQLAAGLQARGLRPREAVALMLPTGRDYLECFFGILFAGAVPVPIYPPVRLAQLADHLRRHAGILDNARTRLLITVPEGKAAARLLRANVDALRDVVTPQELRQERSAWQPVAVAADDVALLQYTSGSTGQPKGVMLTHRQLLANIRAMGRATHAASTDVFVSWLPLYHDMGLIGAWLGSLVYAMPAVLMQPVTFLARPSRWLWAIHEHRGTLSAAPNFAYELCVGKIPEDHLEGLDLSSWRLAFNGAEPVSPATLRRFGQRFGGYGFRPEAQAPVYGLAECGVGLTFPAPGRGPLIDRVAREPLERLGVAQPAPAQQSGALEFVACGTPLPGYEIRVVDEAGRELAERRVGRLEFRGPSATDGYMRNPDATAALFHDGWLDSGDLAYLHGGELYLTSRVKDIIIRGGRNIHPYELEQAVGELDGIRKGCVAVFGSREADAVSERLVVVAETRETADASLAELRARIESAASDLLGAAPDDVVLTPPHTVLKTSSGKIRRTACRELYEQGRLGSAPPAIAGQLARLWLTGVWSRWRRARRRAAERAYAAWVYLIVGLTAAAAAVAVTVLPTLRWRWRVTGALCRGVLRLARVPVEVHGVGMLAAYPRWLLVANHASFADALVLIAVLTRASPVPVAFVAKAELGRPALLRWLLQRLDTRFVERFDSRQGTRDARRLSHEARAGNALLFFPEGTFTRAPGLLPFHLGAFIVAAEAGLPVVPVTLCGTRSLLQGDSWMPRRGPLAVTFEPALVPDDTSWDAALALRDAARRAILRHLGEPDLA